MTITIDGLTKERMLEIEAASVTGGAVDGAGHLILTRHDGAPIDAGSVIGPQGPPYINGVDTVSDQAIGGQKDFTNPIRGAAGAVGAPTFTFTGDPNTGIYNSAPDEVDIATNGVKRMAIRNGGIDLIVPGLNILATTIGVTPLYLNAANGQTSDLLDFDVNGVRKFDIDNNGSLRSLSAASWFGGGARGADMSAVSIGQYDADYALLAARNDVRASTGMLLQSKGNASVVVRIGADTAKNLTVGNDGITYPNRPTAGISLQINREAATLDGGSMRIGRTNSGQPHSIVFNVGASQDFIIGRLGGSDDLVFGVNYGSGFVERMRFTVGGGMEAAQYATKIPAGEFGKATLLSPGNYGRVELQGNSNGLILLNNAGVSKHLIGARFDVTGNSDDCVFYSYVGKYQWWVGGNHVADLLSDANGGSFWVLTNPGVGTDSGLVANFSFVGIRRLSCAAADSAGAGYRTVRIPN